MDKKKLNVILKQDFECYRIGSVICDENSRGSRSVLVKCCGNCWPDVHWPCEFGNNLVERHLTYPENGKMHFTFKFKDPVTEGECFVNGYFDETKYKVIKPGNETEKYYKKGKNLFNFFILEDTPPLNYYVWSEKFFQLPPFFTISFPTQKPELLFEKSVPQLDDIIIDVGTLEKGVLGITCYLCGDRFDDSKLLPKQAQHYKQKIINYGGLKILLLARVDCTNTKS